MGIEGGSKKPLQAREMVKDLAKFQKFASPDCVNFETALDKKAVAAYLNELRRLEVGPSGQVNKLQTIIVSVDFLLSKIPDASPTEAEKEILHKATLSKSKLQALKKQIGKEKVCYFCSILYKTNFVWSA